MLTIAAHLAEGVSPSVSKLGVTGQTRLLFSPGPRVVLKDWVAGEIVGCMTLLPAGGLFTPRKRLSRVGRCGRWSTASAAAQRLSAHVRRAQGAGRAPFFCTAPRWGGPLCLQRECLCAGVCEIGVAFLYLQAFLSAGVWLGPTGCAFCRPQLCSGLCLISVLKLFANLLPDLQSS